MRLRDPRTAIHDATAIHLHTPNVDVYGCKIDISASNDNGGLIVNMLEAGEILNAISRQSNIIKNWLLYAYAAQTTNEIKYLQTLLFNELFDDYPNRQWDRLLKLCAIACEDYKIRTINGRAMPKCTIATVIGVNAQNLERDGWVKNDKTGKRGRLELIHEFIADQDAKGLAVVRGVLDRLNGSE